MFEKILQLAEALEIEKKQDKAQFLASTQKLSLHEKVKNGTCWYPLSIKETGYTVGEYPFVVIEIDKQKLVPHQFKSGASVRFFSNYSDAYYAESVQATVHYVSKNQQKIILYADELPEWISLGKIGVEVEFDERSYVVMEKTMQHLIKANNNRLADLRSIFYATEKNNLKGRNVEDVKCTITNTTLNPSQIAAVKGILASEDVAIIHGPPGTGKTTTLVEAIIQTALAEKQVLVTAPSNTAVDLLVEKLAARGIKVLRIGNISRIDEDVLSHTLDYLLANEKEAKEIKQLKKQADEYKRMAGKYKRNFGASEREQRNLLYKEARELMAQARKVEDYLLHRILQDAQVICTTLIGTENNVLEDKKFKTVFIDEAAQAIEPATWVAISKAEKVVLAGDPFQLPPTVKSEQAEKMGLSKTLMEKALRKLPNVYLLDTQYRMNETLMGYSNQFFYDNKLKAHESVRWNQLYTNDMVFPAIQFVDTAGCGFDEEENERTESLYNSEEYILLFKHLEKNLLQLAVENPSVGIISPYRAQVKYMQEQDENDLQLAAKFDIEIQTIDSFQGQEKDIIYISLVRSNSDGKIGFLKDYRRMNVAMTRARKMLVVIGDSATLGEDAFYKGFIDYCMQHNAYTSAWEFM